MKKLLFIVTFMLLLMSSFALAEETCSVDKLEECGAEVPEDSPLLTASEKELSAIDKIWEEHEEGHICIIYFYSEYCSHCQNIKPYLDEIEEKYGVDIALTRLNIDEIENFQIYNSFCREKEYKGKEIPLVAINNRYFVGEEHIRENLETEIESMLDSEDRICPLTGVMACHAEAGDANQYVQGFSEEGELIWYKTLPAIIFSGLIDGINPCAFAVLLFMMTILLELSGSKKRVFKISVAYIISFLATNISLGLLVYWFSDLVFKGSPWPLRVAAGIAIFAGLVNIKDYFAYGKGFSLQIPKGTKKIIQKWMNYASVPSAIVLGIILAFFEAPCSATIYYAILEMLRNKTAMLVQAIPYIFLYNLMFIVPLVVLFVIIYFGEQIDILEKWRNNHKKLMKLASGLLFLLIGLAILLGWL
jgi:cytochrome c biogenesis protein CcdA